MNAITALPIAEKLLLVARTVPQEDGTVTLEAPDGRVYSCQESGALELRPNGTAGSFEKCLLEGGRAVFNPFGRGAFAFGFCQVPSGD